MSIHGYIWLCIENEEEITVEEEETAPSTENPPAGNYFYFDIFITLYDALGDRSCVLNQLLHFLPWNCLPFLDYLFY
jgi:hypothetical protein